MLLKSMEIELLLAEFFPGKTLELFLAQQRIEVAASVDHFKEALVERIMGVIGKANAAKEHQAAGGNKYTAELKGGTVETFLGGVTGLVGEPHPDIERGIAEEHLLKPDSSRRLTSSNYGVSTTPAIEFQAVMKAMDISIGPASKALQAFVQSGGKGCEAKWITLDDGNTEVKRLSMTETRRCRKSGGGEPLLDLRVLNPIQYYGEFQEDGRLVSYEACDTDTPLQKKVKKARLTRMEIVAIVLYSVYYKTILK
jgi:hypothetical protein